LLREIHFLLKNSVLLDSTSSRLWRLVITWKHIRASPNHHLAEPSRLIPAKRTANLELLIVCELW